MIGHSFVRFGVLSAYAVLSVVLLIAGLGLEYRGYLLATGGETTLGLWMVWMGFVVLFIGITLTRRKFIGALGC